MNCICFEHVASILIADTAMILLQEGNSGHCLSEGAGVD